MTSLFVVVGSTGNVFRGLVASVFGFQYDAISLDYLLQGVDGI